MRAVSVVSTGTVQIHPEHPSVTDDQYFPGGFTGLVYDRLARFDIGEQDTLTARLTALGYAPADVDTAILSHLHEVSNRSAIPLWRPSLRRWM
ncbi:MAG: hypothetical protein ACRDRJ_01410 [Streptosporangiaceae bacterium]